MRLNDLSYDELTEYVTRCYGKSKYHADLIFRQLYSSGYSDPDRIKGLIGNQDLKTRITADLPYSPPEIGGIKESDGTKKFLIKLSDGYETESVIIPMKRYNTLCISSQIGCRRACRFCQTGKMGLIRDLTPGEIVNQVMAAVFYFQEKIRNLVFMGMGEPFDNFPNVMKAVDIISDPRGLNIPKKNISLSTAGHAEGIRKLAEYCRLYPGRHYHTIHLSISLNAPNDRLRNELMPINRAYPLSELKQALLDSPQSGLKDALYFEYIVIPEVNNSPENAGEIVDFLKGMKAKVNIIPFNPIKGTGFRAPDEDEIDIFWACIKDNGRQCRTRRSRGQGIGAACGQLGNIQSID